MTTMGNVLRRNDKPALLIGNGINMHGGGDTSSWDDLLDTLAKRQGLRLSEKERAEMSNTEFFDVLDLAKPLEDRRTLQTQFCDLMETWRPTEHHTRIAEWARRHRRPIVTVNFDENLSRSVDVELFRPKRRFTDYYPWSSYFADHEISQPRHEFAIWHAHGMMKYRRSIRLGLTHYMGSVQRARSWVYNIEDSLRAQIRKGSTQWRGSDTWLDVLFFCPVLIFGFTFGKDENLLRWLFLERAKLQKISSEPSAKTWFVEKENENSQNRRVFFERLGVEFVTVESYEDIYEDEAWGL